MYNGIIIHYNEIAIKGKNRYFFENTLLNNIKTSLKEYKVYKKYGYLLITFKDIVPSQEKELTSLLECIPGIENFSFIKRCALDFNLLKKEVISFLKAISFKTFKVEAKRSNKNFKIKSPEINASLGEEIINNLKKEVDVKSPDLILYVEVKDDSIIIYSEKIKGVGGLPVGSGGKVISSLSGGIDSPVAAYLFMKRGFKVVFVHIYNNTLVKQEIKEKIKELTVALNKFQPKSTLYMVPFSEIQKQIIANIHSDYRMIIYRRYMFRIISQIAEKENCKAIITGDNIGQVASQTIENITSIYSASLLPVFSPVIAFNKNEIISIAKKINTYDISIKPYPDCCSYMLSKHPKIKTNIEEINLLEKEIKFSKKLISNAIKNAEIINS
jgi:tRNA uracil 4-sulfurtransferase